MPNQPTLLLIRRRLLAWYAIHRRNLPWRQTTSPYRILVSEVMLQQTQVDRVVPKYRAWLRQFPTWRVLADAPLPSVLRAWSGLGYNTRARRLRDLARIIVTKYRGRLPTTIEELESLPGIGPYTARAIASFAYGHDTHPMDTNIQRVVTRVFFGIKPPTATLLTALVSRLVPRGHSREWNSALMDFGALVCTSQHPRCLECPIRKVCRAYPAVLTPHQRKKRPTPTFIGSDRYWRGQILRRLLTRGPMTLISAQLFVQRVLPSERMTDRRLQRIFRGLRDDGLVQYRQAKFQIPETAIFPQGNATVDNHP